MRNKLKVLLCVGLLALSLVGCGGGSGKEQVIIYTSAEDYRVEYMRERLDETFPDYDIVIEYMPTSDHAAKLMAEGKLTEADISYDLEYGYMEQLAQAGVFADLEGLYDFSVYTEDAVVSTCFLPEYKNGGAIIMDRAALAEQGLEAPGSYADLLKPEYAGLISMPNPKSSGTGYVFLKALVNELGEEEAFAYFDALTENILSYTSSGSGPVNALLQGEAAIGLSITGAAVTAINNGAELDVLFFEEGSPYAMYGQAIISGKETRPCVKEVFDFLIHTYSYENNEKFFPEQIYRDKTFTVDNYPADIIYADMSGNTYAEKQRLLELWKY